MRDLVSNCDGKNSAFFHSNRFSPLIQHLSFSFWSTAEIKRVSTRIARPPSLHLRILDTLSLVRHAWTLSLEFLAHHPSWLPSRLELQRCYLSASICIPSSDVVSYTHLLETTCCSFVSFMISQFFSQRRHAHISLDSDSSRVSTSLLYRDSRNCPRFSRQLFLAQ